MEIKTLKDIPNKFDIENNSVDIDELKEEAIKWIKLKREIERLEDIKNKWYIKRCKEIPQDLYSNEYHKLKEEYDEPINKYHKQFEELGLKFECKDYGCGQCLDLNGMANVLKAFFNITEEDLK